MVKRVLLAERFDVLVVVWALALGVAFMWACLAHAPLERDHWATPQAGPPWVVQLGEPAPPAP